MNMFRTNSVYLSDEVFWFAKVLNKQLCKSTTNPLTIDEFINAELRNLWTNANPNLVLAWERHCEARQKTRKLYEEIENEAVQTQTS